MRAGVFAVATDLAGAQGTGGNRPFPGEASEASVIQH
jgi:hypothetical protein